MSQSQVATKVLADKNQVKGGPHLKGEGNALYLLKCNVDCPIKTKLSYDKIGHSHDLHIPSHPPKPVIITVAGKLIDVFNCFIDRNPEILVKANIPLNMILVNACTCPL